jgi:hypothetical protein
MAAQYPYPQDLQRQAVDEYHRRRAYIRSLGRRPLSSTLTVVIWGLRLYVLFMIGVVAFNVFQTLH